MRSPVRQIHSDRGTPMHQTKTYKLSYNFRELSVYTDSQAEGNG